MELFLCKLYVFPNMTYLFSRRFTHFVVFSSLEKKEMLKFLIKMLAGPAPAGSKGGCPIPSDSLMDAGGSIPPTLMLSIEAPTSPPLRNFGIVKRRKKEKRGRRRKKKKISLPLIQTLDPPLMDGQSVVTGED